MMVQEVVHIDSSDVELLIKSDGDMLKLYAPPGWVINCNSIRGDDPQILRVWLDREGSQ